MLLWVYPVMRRGYMTDGSILKYSEAMMVLPVDIEALDLLMRGTSTTLNIDSASGDNYNRGDTEKSPTPHRPPDVALMLSISLIPSASSSFPADKGSWRLTHRTDLTGPIGKARKPHISGR